MWDAQRTPTMCIENCLCFYLRTWQYINYKACREFCLAQLSSFKQWIFLLFYRPISPFSFLVDSFVSGKGNLWIVETSLKYVSQWYGCKLKFYIYYITEYSTKLTEKMVYNWIATVFYHFHETQTTHSYSCICFNNN